jgi:hypothetical protein
MRRYRLVGLVAGLAVLAPTTAALAMPTGAAQSAVVAAVPSGSTPNFLNGAVMSLTKVGNTMIAGGTFTSVAPPGQSTGSTANYLVAFDATTGIVNTAFAPVVNGEVDTVVPNATGTAVYIGGRFTTVNGKNTRVASVDLATGASTAGFASPAINAVISDLALSGGSNPRLFVGGKFTTVGGVTHNGLAALYPDTGKIDPSFSVQLTGHHNYGYVSGAAQGAVGAENVALNPAGNRLIVDGNFRTVTDGVAAYSRDQIVSINLDPSAVAAPTVDPNWATASFTKPCFANAYDSYVRDVSWAPDGSYFVVTASGGYHNSSFENCDAVSRFNAGDAGTAVVPAWIDNTGTDSAYSVSVTGTAIYVGGHMRWFNNPYAQDRPGAGSVPRPGLAALDPTTGLPLAWNPGRNPRGHGAELVLATDNGVWVGSDTDYIGNYRYNRGKLAFFPLAGGTAAPGADIGNPTTIYTGGSSGDGFTSRSFDPTTGVAGAATANAVGSGIPWSAVRGAFYLNGRVWYGTSDGKFYFRTFDGSTFGPQTLIDPYNDPYWATVKSGSTDSAGNPILYGGAPPGFYGTQLTNVSGMFYSGGFIYYTVTGKSGLYKRAFSPDTAASSVAGQVTGGIISPVEKTVVSSGYGSASGMFVANGKLWLAKTDGKLYSAGFASGAPTGTPAVDSAAGTGWNGKAVFTSPN